MELLESLINGLSFFSNSNPLFFIVTVVSPIEFKFAFVTEGVNITVSSSSEFSGNSSIAEISILADV